MKKIAVVVILLASSLVANAKIQVDELYYRITSKKVPFTVAVADENRFSFSNYAGLSKIDIPDSIIYNDTIYHVTEIGKSAFANCTTLTSVGIPSNVTTIRKYAFQNCSSLSEVILSEGLEGIGDYSFHGCASLATITIPGTVRYLGNSAFQYCSSLASITLPENITRIGQHAFYGCNIDEKDFINHTYLNERQAKYWGAHILNPTTSKFAKRTVSKSTNKASEQTSDNAPSKTTKKPASGSIFLNLAPSSSANIPQEDPYVIWIRKQTDKAIRKVLREYKAVGISAAVVIGGEVFYNQSFGYQDLESKTPLANDHMMRIASISKSFTATALLQLVDKGIISLDDDVSDLIGFTIRNPHHPQVPITLKMVLSHTASIRDKEDYFTLDHLNPAVYGDCAESYYDYKPGEGYNYSNMGLNLAGTILEKVSGIRFDKYVRDSIILPLGLNGGHNIDMLDSSKIANIYHLEDGKYVKSSAYGSVAHRLDSYIMGYSAPMFSPTGGVKISAHDLAKYMMMHMNYGELDSIRLLSEESAKAMQTPVWMIQDNTNTNEEQYGLCLREFIHFIDDERYNTPGNYPIGHTGGAYGLRSIMIWSPKDGWGIVAMTNGYTGVQGKNILKDLTNAIYEACIKE